MPPEVVFFLDRSLGRVHVSQALRALGARVEIHDDHFPLDARDADWLPEVGRRGWVVLMKDKRIRRNRLERDALLASGVRAFVLTSGNLTGPEMAEVLKSTFFALRSLGACAPGRLLEDSAKLGHRTRASDGLPELRPPAHPDSTPAEVYGCNIAESGSAARDGASCGRDEIARAAQHTREEIQYGLNRC